MRDRLKRYAFITLPQFIPKAIRVGVRKSPMAYVIRSLLNHSLPKAPVIVPLGPPLAGHRMRLDPQGQKAFMYGVYEPAVCDVIQQYVKPDWNVVDIGAHIGYLTLLLSKCVGLGGKVFAFEPLPKNFEVLNENILLNGCRNIHAESKAISNLAGIVAMVPSENGSLPTESRLLLESNKERMVLWLKQSLWMNT